MAKKNVTTLQITLTVPDMPGQTLDECLAAIKHQMWQANWHANAPVTVARVTPPTPKKKATSRSARWMTAVSDAQDALSQVESHMAELTEAMSALEDVKSEYEEWRDNLPENLQSSALADKLNEVADLDLDIDLEDAVTSVRDVLDSAENVDLPQGFGRD